MTMMKINQRLLTGRLLAGWGGALELSSHRVLIRLPHPKLFQLIARTAVIALVIISFPWILSKVQHKSSSVVDKYQSSTESSMQKLNLHRKFLSLPESKKEALNGLEDADLEPPTQKKYRPKTKYLPDLMGDSLADYPRRVFVDVGPAGRTGSEKWFEKHYPKKNLEFEVIRIDEVGGGNGNGGSGGVGMNEWLERNVKEEEYVVMKAEAAVVEEMVKGKVIGLVDELFLECKNQWMRGKKSKRAYWECLALYGRLKDEGVAVHQWWG